VPGRPRPPRALAPIALALAAIGCAHGPAPEKLSFRDAGLGAEQGAVDKTAVAVPTKTVPVPADPVGPVAPPPTVPAPRSIATERPDVPPMDGELIRFASEARTRRFNHASKKGFPAESVAAWERLAGQLDAYLAQALPQTPLLELVRARVTLDAEWEYDRRRFGAPPADLAHEIQLRADRLGVRIGAARALGQKIFLAKRTPGRLAWPVERPGISSTFGMRTDPMTGEKRMHPGLDLAAEKGRVVWAAAKGYVVRAGWTAGYGLLVEIRHNAELTTRYSHLSALLCQPGDEVAPGRPVGLVGSTGRSTGPHLHFEVWEGGMVRDPMKWLGDWVASKPVEGAASN
jgi:murein DD-endopeptidase MepM/ murein hydrolase activator NlpD